MVSKLIKNAVSIHFKNSGIKIDRITNKYLYIVVPKTYNPDNGLEQRLLQFTRKTWGIGLKIKKL
jgi:hypothetical protein